MMHDVSKKILVIGQDEKVNGVFQQIFAGTKYMAVTVLREEDALRLLERVRFDLVISALKAPVMSGYQLLVKIKGKYPDIIRIISSPAEEREVFRALSQNVAKLYIQFPIAKSRLLSAIGQVFATSETLRRSNVLEHMNNLEELPTIGENYLRIIRLTEHETEIKKIADEIEKDRSIALKILHIANSCYYGIRTGSVLQAILYLGLDNVRNLVLSISIMDMFSQGIDDAGLVDFMWKQAFVTNKLIGLLYREYFGISLPEPCQTAGLLHDVGEAYFLKYYTHSYLRILMEGRQAQRLEEEKEAFGLTHCEAGGYLLQWWELPYPIVETALYHHIPLDKRVLESRLVCAAHLADRYACTILGKEYAQPFYESVFYKLGISQPDFERRISTVDFT